MRGWGALRCFTKVSIDVLIVIDKIWIQLLESWLQYFRIQLFFSVDNFSKKSWSCLHGCSIRKYSSITESFVVYNSKHSLITLDCTKNSIIFKHSLALWNLSTRHKIELPPGIESITLEDHIIGICVKSTMHIDNLISH